MFDQPLNVPLSSRYNSVQCTQSCGSSPHSVITPDTGTDLLDDLLSHKLLPMNDNIVVKTKLTTDVMIIYHYNARTPIQMQYTTISLKYFFNSHISYRTWTPLSMSTTKEHGFHIALRLWCVSAPTVHCTVRVGLSPVCCYMCDLTRSSTKTFFLSIHLSSAEYSGLAHFTESLNAPTPPPRMSVLLSSCDHSLSVCFSLPLCCNWKQLWQGYCSLEWTASGDGLRPEQS